MSEPTAPPTAPVGPTESRRAGLLGAIDNAGVPMLLTRLAVGGTFLYLGAPKTRYPLDLVKVIDTYGMFPVDPPHMLNLDLLGILIFRSCYLGGENNFLFYPSRFSGLDR